MAIIRRRTSRENVLDFLRVAVAAAVLACLTGPAIGQWPPPRPADREAPDRAKKPAKNPPRTEKTRASGGWSIVLEVHSGEKAIETARQRAGVLAGQIGRGDIHVRPTARGAAVVTGAFVDPKGADAREALRQVRGIQMEGRLPFAQAFFAPPLEAVDLGTVPELNLLNARQVFGSDKEYSLQIGFYQSDRPEEAKKAAEEAALQLRREGELAFYYHGPSMSLVTVGLFGDSDFDPQARARNPALFALQERYPLNLHNGKFPIIEKAPGQPDMKQPSQLVRIP